MTQKKLALWLKLIIIVIAVCGIIAYAVVIPNYGMSLAARYPEFSGRFWPWLVFIWISGIPCYAVLVLGWLITSGIAKDQAFTVRNARYMKWISQLAAADSVFFLAGNLVLWFLNMSHPGIVLLSLVVVFAGIAVSVAAAALSHLIGKAADLQEQSDLTI